MLKFLFRGLTADTSTGAALFDALTAEARRPHWYVEAAVPDTLEGRFAVLATVLALTLVRLESEGDRGNRMSVTLTERFIEVMESEHRQLGVGDPTLGRTVRKLVGMLARRTDLWRAAGEAQVNSYEATRESLYKDNVDADALRQSASALDALRQRLAATSLDELQQGNVA
jgi:cytochrome b pre-mRNA-processing protein 3